MDRALWRSARGPLALATAVALVACGGSTATEPPDVATATPSSTRPAAFASEKPEASPDPNNAPRDLTGTLDPAFLPIEDVQGIALDGATAWVTAIRSETITVFDLAGTRLDRSFEVDGRPHGLAVLDGTLWAVDSGGRSLLRIDPQADLVVAEIKVPAGRVPRAVAAGAGALWLASNGTGEVVRIDPTTNEIVATINGGGINTNRLTDVLFAFDRVWTIDATAGSVLEIDPGSNSVVRTHADLGAVNSTTSSDAAGALRLAADDTVVWVLSEVASGRRATALFSIDPVSGATVKVVELPLGPDPGGLPGLLVDSRGGAWIALDERLVRVALAERRADTVHTDISVHFSTLVELDGRVWFGMASSFDSSISGLYGVQLSRITGS
ncbi:MAG: hypothetical protein AB1736_15410 [Chloroflexota bacterium]